MDYSDLFRRAAELVWARKFLVVLGMLAVFGSSGGSSGALSNLAGGDGGLLSIRQSRPLIWDALEINLATPAIMIIAFLIFAIGAAFFVVGTLARGGLIAGVNGLDRGKPVSFSTAWNAAADKIWTLLGIGLLPALPAFLGVLLGLGGIAVSGGLIYVGEAASFLGGGAAFLSAVLTSILFLAAFVLGLLQVFANRAAMLEGGGVFDAYGRGFSVLSQNIGSALAIFLIQIGLSLLLGLLLLVPGIILALCFLFWPLFFIFQGFMTAFFSAIWTRAWEQWTNALPAKHLLAGQ